MPVLLYVEQVKVVIPVQARKSNAYARFERLMKSWPYWEHDYSRLRPMFEQNRSKSFLDGAGDVKDASAQLTRQSR